jgi:putative transposase
MRLNQYGQIAESVWQELPLHYPDINNSIFIVMPNHIHGLILIEGFRRAGYKYVKVKPAPTIGYFLSEIVRALKTETPELPTKGKGVSDKTTLA